MEIRDVRPEEYPEAGRVTELAYREFAPAEDSGWQEYLAEIADVEGRVDRTVVLAAVEDGRILGTATVEIDRTIGDDDETLPPEMASLRMLGVHPEARGRGIGRALVEAAVRRALLAGKSLMVLRTTEQMRTAQGLYASMGFERDPGRDMVFEDGFRLIGYRLNLEPGDGP
jgi:GNAT superfamily N-acetyltransferase